MLTWVFTVGRLFMARGWMIGLLLVLLTVGLGTGGFWLTAPDDWPDTERLSDALYKAIGLLAIETGAVPTAGNWALEVARWCGLVFWASALLTLVVRLFRESVHRLMVRVLAADHVIVAGLGDGGARLVENLRADGRTVVVIEPNRNHPAAERCMSHGAVVLIGAADDPGTLRAAQLTRAQTVLALFDDERVCVQTATAVYRLLEGERATRRSPPVRCVLRLTEPGLLDIVRRHRIKTDPDDRFQLEILNAHEIAATTMVREAVANSPRPIRRLLVLGLGTHHRLGEMVVLRASKDHLLDPTREDGDKLSVHVYDKDAAAWLASAASRYPFLSRACDIQPYPCWARKVGKGDIRELFDAAFVCIGDEGHATAQAVALRTHVLTAGQPIMVQVSHSQAGFGELISQPLAGWGENIHPIGLEDPLFDPHAATQPELELRARTIHHDYRTRRPPTTEPANKPWALLDETFREANRQLAARYAGHLSWIGGGKTTAYRMAFQPDGFTGSGDVFAFSDAELDALAEQEHKQWLAERERDGWRHGDVKDPVRKLTPRLVPYTQLTEADRENNREFVRRLPIILARADYAIVPNTTPSDSCDSRTGR